MRWRYTRADCLYSVELELVLFSLDSSKFKMLYFTFLLNGSFFVLYFFPLEGLGIISFICYCLSGYSYLFSMPI